MEQVYKRNDFIVKLFACLFIAIFLVFTFIGSKVFADYDIIIDNNSYILPDKATYYSYYDSVSAGQNNVLWLYNFDDNNNIKFVAFFSSGDFYIYEENNKKYYCCSSSYTQLPYDYDSHKFTNRINGSSGDVSVNNLSNYSGIAFCSNDVYDTDGSLVFPIPPQEQDKVLAPIVEGEEMKPLQEILQILPIVMIVVVGYLALRKGLATLFRFLRTS